MYTKYRNSKFDKNTNVGRQIKILRIAEIEKSIKNPIRSLSKLFSLFQQSLFTISILNTVRIEK